MKTIGALLMAAAAAVAMASSSSPSKLWVPAGTSIGTEEVTFSLALPMQNKDKLDAFFTAVSDPKSPTYGQYMTRDEVNALTAAPTELRESVMATMKAAGASCVEKTGDSIKCTAPVSVVNSLLKTSMTAYKHRATGAITHLVDGSHTFPAELVGKVDFISGLSMLPAERYGRSQLLNLEGSSSTGAPQGSTLSVVPETLSNLYNLDAGKGSASVTQGAVEYQGAPAWTQSDLDTFIKNTGIPSFSVSHTGPFNDLQAFAESTLDVQYLGAVGAGNTNDYFTTATWMYDYCNEVLAGTFTADVQSSSYGFREDQNCVINPLAPPCANGGVGAYISATNALFQKVGATGITLVVAAGDAGAHGREDQSCVTGVTNPDFPASSPYVTSVGATQLSTDAKSEGATAPICKSELKCATSGSEQVCSYGTGALITSGGGFSNYAPRPAYQDAAVAAYLKNSAAVPPAGDFNASGRGYPDVAALGHAYYIELQGQAVAVDGTSCAAPVFSGVLALLNAYLVEAGKPKLGFANPFLYQMAAEHPAAFNDITVGSNKCTSFLCEGCTGFEAVTGWDAATGVGTPNLKEMLAYLAAKHDMPAPSQNIVDAANKMQQRVNKMFSPTLRGMGMEGFMRQQA